MPKITDIFFCPILNGTMAYITCIKRQFVNENFDFITNIKYFECSNCKRGTINILRFRDTREFKEIKRNIRYRGGKLEKIPDEALERIVEEFLSEA